MKRLSEDYRNGYYMTTWLTASVIAVFLLAASPCMAKVLFLAHYNNEGVNADYALGDVTALPAPRSGLELTGLIPNGRWGSGLDLSDPLKGNCTYRAAGNLDPQKGTVDFWYCIDEAGETYNPIFDWYVHEDPAGSGKKVSGFELYRYGANVIFAVYEPYTETSTVFDMDIGNWHHMEINWDCTGGDGKSEYNVYLDGKNVVRMTEAIAFKSGGGFLHPGTWDYAWTGITLRGRIDEVRVTDQVEHLSNFTPSQKEYVTPGTPRGVAANHTQAAESLKSLQRDIRNLSKAVKLAGEHSPENQTADVIKRSEDVSKNAENMLNSLGESMQNLAMDSGGSQDTWQENFAALSDEQVKQSGSDLSLLQNKLDEVSDTIKSARFTAVQTTGLLYQQIPAIYNRATVNLGHLKNELEGFKRAALYVNKMIAPDRVGPAIKRYDKTVSSVTNKLHKVSGTFYGMFRDSIGGKRDPVAAIPALAADRKKSKLMQTLFATLSETAKRIDETRVAISAELQGLRDSDRFKERFPDYTPFVPEPLPPLEVSADGTLKRLVYGGTWGRTETMMALGFDTLTETGASVKWVKKDKFDVVESANTLRQWEKYQMRVSNTVFLYAVGDSMYRPEWFAEEYDDNPEYYFRNTQGAVGSTGFDYRHPVPRKLIVQYLEEAARINGQKPYTFMYKGPWEAHPYTGWSVDVPGQRTAAFKEHGFSPVAVEAFRNYLKEKFSSIGALNDAWRSSYEDFSDIEPPDPQIRAYVVTKDERDQDVYTVFFPNKRVPGLPTTGLSYEFERCRKDLYADYLEDCYKAIKRGDPTRPLANSTSGGIMDEIQLNSLDDLQMPQRCVDMWGKHPSGGFGWDNSPYMYGLNRYFNKTLVALEYYGWAQEVIGDDFWPTFKLAPGAEPEDVYNAGRRDTWHEFSWDRRMLLFYWVQKIVELPEGFRAETSPLARPWSSFFSVMKSRTAKINDILFNVPIVKPRIAVLHPGVSIINAYPTDACMKIAKDVFDCMLAKQYHFGIVPEAFVMNGRDSLDRYDVVILPYVQYFEDGFDRKLMDWVKRGGTLISAGPFGLYGKYGFEIDDSAAAVFPDVTFSYPQQGEFEVSWLWEGARDDRPVTESYLEKSYGDGHVLMTLDGRGFARSGAGASQAHVGIEIGAKVKGEESGAAEEKKPDDRSRPLKLIPDSELPPAVTALYQVLQNATSRQASVTKGNVEMVLRQKSPSDPLYMSLLNWDYRDGLETEIMVRGEYNNVTDLSIAGGFPIPTIVQEGLTRFKIVFGPGEGLMLEMK